MAATPKTYTNTDVHKMIKGIIDPTLLSLNGMLDKVPAAMKGELKDLHDKFNTLLNGLGPIEQIPAAQDVGWAMERLCDCLQRLTELKDGLTQKFASLTSEYNSLNGQIGTELLKKSDVAVLLDKAKEDGRKLMLPAIVAGRKTAIEACGLPHPPDEILGAEEGVFGPRFTEAQAQAKKLAGKGLKKGTKAGDAWLPRCWQPATEFAGTLTLLEDLNVGTTEPGPDPARGGGDPTGGGRVAAGARQGAKYAGFA